MQGTGVTRRAEGSYRLKRSATKASSVLTASTPPCCPMAFMSGGGWAEAGRGLVGRGGCKARRRRPRLRAGRTEAGAAFWFVRHLPTAEPPVSMARRLLRGARSRPADHTCPRHRINEHHSTEADDTPSAVHVFHRSRQPSQHRRQPYPKRDAHP